MTGGGSPIDGGRLPEVVGGGGLRLVVDPAHGGRIVSLRHDGHEWLAPSTPAPPGWARFVHAGTGGWDEVLPTVAADGRFPDHGDLWNAAWDVGASGLSALDLSARSASAGVTLERAIVATADGIELRYRASTDADEERCFLWSVHPLITALPGTTFEFPGVERRVDLVEEYPSRGDVRRPPTHSWLDDAGSERAGVKAFLRSSALAPADGGRVSASIVRANGRPLTFSWVAADIPWLGLYWDSGEFSPAPVIALEPTSSGSDAADRADTLWSVRRDRPLTWDLRVAATHP